MTAIPEVRVNEQGTVAVRVTYSGRQHWKIVHVGPRDDRHRMVAGTHLADQAVAQWTPLQPAQKIPAPPISNHDSAPLACAEARCSRPPGHGGPHIGGDARSWKAVLPS